MAIRRFSFVVSANESGGAYVPVRLDAGVLLALKTSPGTPGPRRRFDVVLLDEVGHDVLCAVGHMRSPTRVQRSIVRSPRLAVNRCAHHPVVGPEPLKLVVLNLRQCESVRVDVFIGTEAEVRR